MRTFEQGQIDIFAHSIDYDGCATTGTDALKKYIAHLLEQHPSAISILMVGSYRQTGHIDFLGECQSPIHGSCFSFFEDFLAEIHAQYPDLAGRVTLNKFLLEDLYQGKSPGTHFDEAKKLSMAQKITRYRESGTRYIIPWHDYTKRASTYAQMHHIATQYPEKKITMIVYDDRDDAGAPILSSLYRLYSEKRFVPKNMQLRLQHYRQFSNLRKGRFGDFCAAYANQTCSFCDNSVHLQPIKGAGEIDFNYHETAQLLGHDQEKRISHALHLHIEKHGLHSVIQFMMLNIPEDMRAILFDHLIVIAIQKNNLRAIQHAIKINGGDQAFIQNIFVIACFQKQFNTARLFAPFVKNLSASLTRHLAKGESWELIENACGAIMTINQSTSHSNVMPLFDLLPFAIQHKRFALANALISAATIEEKEREVLHALVKTILIMAHIPSFASLKMFQTTIEIISAIVKIDGDLLRLQLYSNALPEPAEKFPNEVLLILLYLCSKNLKKPIDSINQLIDHLFFTIMITTNNIREIKEVYLNITLEEKLRFHFEQACAYLFILRGIYLITEKHNMMICHFISSQLLGANSTMIEQYTLSAIAGALSQQSLDSQQQISYGLIEKLRQQENSSDDHACKLAYHALRCTLLYTDIDSPTDIRNAIQRWKDAINPKNQKPNWLVLAEEDERMMISESRSALFAHARFINNLPNEIAKGIAQSTPPLARSMNPRN